MLCEVRSHGDRARILQANFKIDVADCGIKRSRAGIRRRLVPLRTSARKENHVSRAVLKTRRILAERECGPVGPESDQPNARPKVDRLRDSVAPRRNEQDALTGKLSGVR